MIDRRGALQGVAALFGAALFAPIGRALANTPLVGGGPPSGPVLTPAQRALLVQLGERIMPTTDTPGAIAAGVPDYIEKLLADWALPEDKAPIIAGLDTVDRIGRETLGKAPADATPVQQDALLTLAMNDGFPGGAAFFEALRQLVLTGYFTSEIGITQERVYLPVPGRYDGAYPFEKVGRVFSS
jgi:hypothetical protein